MKLHIQLTPNASSNSIEAYSEDLHGNTIYKCRIAAPPADGKANAALIDYLSEQLDVPSSAITILKGHRSRHKVVGIDKDDLVLPF